MITICEECGRKYQIDPGKIRGKAAAFSCKGCGNRITVTRPDASRTKPAASAADARPGNSALAPQRAEESIASKKPEAKAQRRYSLAQPPRFRFGLAAKLFSVMLLVGVAPVVIFWIVSLSQTQERIPLLLLSTVLSVAIIAWFSGRAISRPILKLTEAATRISVGDLDTEIAAKRKDEIGDLAEAFARMQDSIRIAIERLRRKS